MNNEFGRMLKLWRNRLKLSQQQLSGLSGISTKHLSFLETGRSRPTRSMVDKLALNLQLTAEDHQLLCEYAGFQTEGFRSEMDEGVRQALQMMLDAHEPYPGVVTNYILQPQMINKSAERLFQWLDVDRSGFSGGLDFVLSKEGILKHMVDWEATVAISMRLLHGKAKFLGDDASFQAQLGLLLRNPALKAIWDDNAGYHGSVLPSVPIKLCKDGVQLDFHMILSTFGTPRGLGLTETEYQMDFLYPADKPTEHWLREMHNER